MLFVRAEKGERSGRRQRWWQEKRACLFFTHMTDMSAICQAWRARLWRDRFEMPWLKEGTLGTRPSLVGSSMMHRDVISRIRCVPSLLPVPPPSSRPPCPASSPSWLSSYMQQAQCHAHKATASNLREGQACFKKKKSNNVCAGMQSMEGRMQSTQKDKRKRSREEKVCMSCECPCPVPIHEFSVFHEFLN